jgi:hypothetical protein
LWETEDGQGTAFVCGSSHRFTDTALVCEHDRSVQATLCRALRALREAEELLRRQGAHAGTNSSPSVQSRMREFRQRSDAIRRVVDGLAAASKPF